MPLYVGRKSSIAAVDFAIKSKSLLFLATQKETQNETPDLKDIYQIGCVAKILQADKDSQNNIKLLVAALYRA